MFQKSNMFRAVRGAFALAGSLLCLASPAALGHGSGNYDPMDPPEGTVFDGFRCTTHGGVVMQANLSAGCAEWWPGCRRKPDPPPPGKKCPNSCKRAYFIVRHVPVYGADEWIHHRGGYNSYNSEQNYGSYGSGGSQGSGKFGKVDPKYLGSKGSGKKGRPVDEDGVPDYSAEAVSSEDDGGGPAAAGGTALQNHASGQHSQASSRAESESAGTTPAAVAAGPSPALAGAKAEAGVASAPTASPAPRGGTAAGNAVGGQGPITLERAMELAAKASGGARDFSADAAGADPQAKSNYSDPWMDYIAGTSRAELVDKLEHDAKMRADLRKRIDDMVDASGASSATVRDKVEYYRKALAEAEARLRQGGLQALKPLDMFEEETRPEAFAMNSDETDREIRRLLASMDDSAATLEDKDEGKHYPLFSRVHRSLWRQLASGNIVLKARKR